MELPPELHGTAKVAVLCNPYLAWVAVGIEGHLGLEGSRMLHRVVFVFESG